MSRTVPQGIPCARSARAPFVSLDIDFLGRAESAHAIAERFQGVARFPDWDRQTPEIAVIEGSYKGKPLRIDFLGSVAGPLKRTDDQSLRQLRAAVRIVRNYIRHSIEDKAAGQRKALNQMELRPLVPLIARGARELFCVGLLGLRQIPAIAAAGLAVLTDGHDADATAITLGALRPEHQQQALASVGKNGVVVCTALPKATDVDFKVSIFDLTFQQQRIQGLMFGAVSQSWDILKMVHMYQGGRLKRDGAISATDRLKDLNQGYADLHAGHKVRGVILYH